MPQLPQTQNDPIINFPNSYKSGLVLSLVNTAPLTFEATKLAISAGACRDSNNVMDIVIGSQNVEGSLIPAPLVIDLAADGANGLDTGTIAANTMYAIYMIADSRYYLPTAAIATLSSNALPSMPRGYDSYRLIGFWATSAASILLQGYYFGNGNDMTFFYSSQEPVVVGAVASAVVNLARFVPSIDDVNVGIQVGFAGTTVSNINNWYNGYDNSGADYVLISTQVALVTIYEQIELMTGPLVGGVPTVRFVVGAGGAGGTVNAYVMWFAVSL